tara:strand:+ start:1196 stop:1549 length:354 start_codon:yes stop_codon:yes gene_type:complete
MTTNKLKGEYKLTLAGKDYKARLNIDAIMRIEAATNKSVIQLAQDMGTNQGITISQILVVLTNALRGGGNDLSEADVKNIIAEGYMEAVTSVAQILTKTLTGHSEEETEQGKQEQVE